MKLFSKITFICNLSFLVTIILRYVELNNKKHNVNDNIIPLPYLTGILVILGQLSIFINLLFCLVALVLFLSKKEKQMPGRLTIFNFIFLFVQFFYFLFT
ncbi:MAG: hypothetical protein ABIN67_21375 [Ferruginibacter sp.]